MHSKILTVFKIYVERLYFYYNIKIYTVKNSLCTTYVPKEIDKENL